MLRPNRIQIIAYVQPKLVEMRAQMHSVLAFYTNLVERNDVFKVMGDGPDALEPTELMAKLVHLIDMLNMTSPSQESLEMKSRAMDMFGYFSHAMLNIFLLLRQVSGTRITKLCKTLTDARRYISKSQLKQIYGIVSYQERHPNPLMDPISVWHYFRQNVADDFMTPEFLSVGMRAPQLLAVDNFPTFPPAPNAPPPSLRLANAQQITALKTLDFKALTLALQLEKVFNSAINADTCVQAMLRLHNALGVYKDLIRDLRAFADIMGYAEPHSLLVQMNSVGLRIMTMMNAVWRRVYVRCLSMMHSIDVRLFIRLILQIRDTTGCLEDDALVDVLLYTVQTPNHSTEFETLKTYLQAMVRECADDPEPITPSNTFVYRDGRNVFGITERGEMRFVAHIQHSMSTRVASPITYDMYVPCFPQETPKIIQRTLKIPSLDGISRTFRTRVQRQADVARVRAQRKEDRKRRREQPTDAAGPPPPEPPPRPLTVEERAAADALLPKFECTICMQDLPVSTKMIMPCKCKFVLCCECAYQTFETTRGRCPQRCDENDKGEKLTRKMIDDQAVALQVSRRRLVTDVEAVEDEDAHVNTLFGIIMNAGPPLDWRSPLPPLQRDYTLGQGPGYRPDGTLDEEYIAAANAAHRQRSLFGGPVDPDVPFTPPRRANAPIVPGAPIRPGNMPGAARPMSRSLFGGADDPRVPISSGSMPSDPRLPPSDAFRTPPRPTHRVPTVPDAPRRAAAAAAAAAPNDDADFPDLQAALAASRREAEELPRVTGATQARRRAPTSASRPLDDSDEDEPQF